MWHIIFDLTIIKIVADINVFTVIMDKCYKYCLIRQRYHIYLFPNDAGFLCVFPDKCH